MKYTVKFSCGHEARIDISGPTKDRERKIEWYTDYGLCPECYTKEMEAKKANGCTVRTMPYYEYKSSWPWLKTKGGSYNEVEKTVGVYIPDDYSGLEEYLGRMAGNRCSEEGYRNNAEIVRDALQNGEITQEQAKVLATAARAMRF